MIEDKEKMNFHLKDPLEAESLHSCPQALHKTGAEARPSAASDKVYTWACESWGQSCLVQEWMFLGQELPGSKMHCFLDSWLTSVN